MKWHEIQTSLPKDGEEVLAEVNHGDGTYHSVIRWSDKTQDGVVAWANFKKRMPTKNEGSPESSTRVEIGTDVRGFSLKHTQVLFAKAQERVSKNDLPVLTIEPAQIR